MNLWSIYTCPKLQFTGFKLNVAGEPLPLRKVGDYETKKEAKQVLNSIDREKQRVLFYSGNTLKYVL